MGLDLILSGCAIAAEVALVLLLIKKHAFRSFPFFFSYILWSLVSDAVLRLTNSLPAVEYFRIYVLFTVIDSAMMLAVLVELAWSVLRPVRASLPRYSLAGISLLMVIAGLALWPVARFGFSAPASDPPLSTLGIELIRLQQTFSVLRVVVFVALAGFSQLLAIGWRSRELQVATGLGLYSIVSLAVSVMQTHQSVNQPQYILLGAVASASYVCSLTYWVYAFATKEAVRQEFSPQMQQLFLAVAGAAQADRVSLSDSSSTRSKTRGDR